MNANRTDSYAHVFKRLMLVSVIDNTDKTIKYTQRDAKKKGKKKSQTKRDAADVNLVAAAEYKNPRKSPGGANLFDEMLKEPCPHHQGPVKHTLEECAMLQCHFHKAGPPAEGGRARDDDKKEDHQAGEFPEVRDCFNAMQQGKGRKLFNFETYFSLKVMLNGILDCLQNVRTHN